VDVQVIEADGEGDQIDISLEEIPIAEATKDEADPHKDDSKNTKDHHNK